MAWKFYNQGVMQLALPMNIPDVTCTVFDSSMFSEGPEFPIVCATEIMYVTNIVGNVLTVSRAEEGTSAIIHNIGDNLYYALTAGVLNSATIGPEGPPGQNGLSGGGGDSLTEEDVREIVMSVLNEYGIS